MLNLLLALLTFSTANAAVPPTSAEQAYQVQKNILKNPGFEEGKVSWTAGGTYTVTTVNGNKVANWQPTAIGQTFAQTVAVGKLAGNVCVAQMNWLGADSSGYVMEVLDGSANVLRNFTSFSAKTVFAPAIAVFTCPTTGNVTLQLRSLTASPAAIQLDDMVVGTGSPQVPAQIGLGGTWVGSIKVYGCSGAWTQNNTGAFANFTTLPTGCQYVVTPGSTGISAPATNVPGFILTGGTGVYRLEASSLFYNQGTNGNDVYFRFSDGTVSSIEENATETAGAYLGVPSISGVLNYTSAPSAKTVQIQARTGNTNAGVYAQATSISPTGNAQTLTINVYRYPTQASLAGSLITKDPVTSASSQALTLVSSFATPCVPYTYRNFTRNANAFTYTDATPATAPSAANGFLINSGAYANSTASARIEVCLGSQKTVDLKGWQSAGRVNPIDFSHSYYGTAIEVGVVWAYDKTSGIAYVDAGSAASSITQRQIGYSQTPGGGNTAQSSGLFDFYIYDNPLAAGLSPAIHSVRVSGANGLGGSSSGDTGVNNFLNIIEQKGSDAIYVPRTTTTGDIFKAGSTGAYCLSISAGFASAANAGITINADAYTNTNVGGTSIPSQFVLTGITTSTGTGFASGTTWCGPLNAGDRLRFQSASAYNTSNQIPYATFFKVPSPFEIAGSAGTGNVVSSSNDRLERFRATAICTASPCAITDSTSGVTSVTRTSTGRYTVNFAAGTFSGPPTCVYQAYNFNGSNTAAAYIWSTPTALADYPNFLAGGVSIDAGFQAICQGPRGSN